MTSHQMGLVLFIFTPFLIYLATSTLPPIGKRCDYGYTDVSASSVGSLTSVIDEIHDVHSKIHCAVYCLDEIRCETSHYSKEDHVCFLTGSTGATVLKEFAGISAARVQPQQAAGAQSCDDLGCSEDSICLYSCTEGGNPEPYCAVDAQACGSSPQITNLAHFYKPANSDDTNNGYVQRVSYTKVLPYTDIRVQWYATIGGITTAGGCSRWRVLFNGADCTNPGRIENVDYESSQHLIDDRRMSDVDGICKDFAAGSIEVGIWVDACPSHSSYNSKTGGQNSLQMIIYEIDTREGVDKGCPGLSIYNEQQYAETRPDGTDTMGHVVMTLAFTKADADSSIFVQYNANSRVLTSSTGTSYCGRWYVTFDGNECSQPERVEMILGPQSNNNGAYNYRRNPYKHYSMWGMCGGVAAGTVSIQVRIGQCVSYKNDATDLYSGWNSWGRLMAQEVREGQNNSIVMLADGRLERLRMFNVAHHAWYQLNYDNNIGTVKELTYEKKEAESGLRLSWMGDHRIYGSGAARWFFSIDGIECSSPGPISGVAYTDQSMNYYRPGLVSGICYGISSGTHIIRYNVGELTGYTTINAYTGWRSTSRMIVMEVFVDNYKYCTSSLSSSCTLI